MPERRAAAEAPDAPGQETSIAREGELAGLDLAGVDTPGDPSWLARQDLAGLVDDLQIAAARAASERAARAVEGAGKAARPEPPRPGAPLATRQARPEPPPSARPLAAAKPATAARPMQVETPLGPKPTAALRPQRVATAPESKQESKQPMGAKPAPARPQRVETPLTGKPDPARRPDRVESPLPAPVRAKRTESPSPLKRPPGFAALTGTAGTPQPELESSMIVPRAGGATPSDQVSSSLLAELTSDSLEAAVVPEADIAFQLPTLLRRTSASLIDAAVIVILMAAPISAGVFGETVARVHWLDPDEVSALFSNGQLLLPLIAAFVLVFAATTLQHGFLGRSLGKLALGLELVTSKQGTRPSLFVASVRGALTVLSLAMFGAGYFFVLINRRERTLHDVLSGTVTVRASSRRAAPAARARVASPG